MKFSDRIANIRVDAMDAITEIMKGREGLYELCDPALYDGDDGIAEELYNFPRTFTVDKYNNFTEYVLISALHTPSGVLFGGISLFDDFSGEDLFHIKSISTESLCEIADHMRKLEGY